MEQPITDDEIPDIVSLMRSILRPADMYKKEAEKEDDGIQ